MAVKKSEVFITFKVFRAVTAEASFVAATAVKYVVVTTVVATVALQLVIYRLPLAKLHTSLCLDGRYFHLGILHFSVAKQQKCRLALWRQLCNAIHAARSGVFKVTAG